jgi:tetratricopeptide (TPR) repeat protein
MTLDWQDETAPKMDEARAVAVLRQGIAARPDDAALKLRLARMLYARDAMAETVDLLLPLAGPDASDELLSQLGRAAWRLGKFDIAFDALERCRDPAARGFFAALLADMERPDEALAIAREALAAHPDDRQAILIAGKVLIARGGTAALLMLCRELLARGARNTRMLSLLALSAWAEDAPEAALLLDRTRLFSRHADLPFDLVLKDELLNYPALVRPQSYKATRGDGVRIEHLESYSGPRAQALLGRIRRAVETYLDERADLAEHPALAARGNRLELRAWSTVLRGDGHEATHVHPSAWLSGVYYVAVPPAESDHAGAIGFEHVFEIPGRDMSGFPSWQLQPREGELLLFPSYFAHRTWPTGSPAPRITVAFDVVVRDGS